MNDDVKAFNDAIQQAFYSKYSDYMDQMGKEALVGAITKATIDRFFEQLRAQLTYIDNLRPPEA